MSEAKKTGKWQLYLMLAIVLGVLIAGFLVFPKTPEEREALLAKIGTTNHGELLAKAVEIQPLALTSMDEQPWVFADQKLKWRIVIIGDETCTGACRDLLYTTHQVHVRLGKNAHRFERIYLTSANQLSEKLAATIEKEHPYLKILKIDQGALNSWLNEMAVPDQDIAILVDQNGLAMMLYTNKHNGGGMLEDINHLLKYSPAK